MVGTWIKRSLRHYRTRHLVFAGTVALSSAILCAALLAGESLQQGLQRDLNARLGTLRSVVHLSEGVFPATLAQRLPEAQAALLLKGELLTAAGALCADTAQVLGVADSGMTPTCHAENSASFPDMLSSDGLIPAALNTRGREALPDAEGAIRFEKPARFSVELPLGAARQERMVRRAVRFNAVSASASAGRGQPQTIEQRVTPDFALRAASVRPVNVILPYAALAAAAGVPGLANLLVSAMQPEAFEQSLAAALTPEDAGLILEAGFQVSGDGRPGTVITSQRVFLRSAVTEALEAAGLATQRSVFHLADAFEAGTNTTPYGFVAAMTPGSGCVLQDLRDDEIVINAWLAETLGVETNDLLTLRWRRFEAGGRLAADSRAFRIRAVIPTDMAAVAKAAMPVFPGMAGVDSCAAWDVGLPMDEEKLKDAANEAYWKQWRETPKAFLTFAAGKACFGTVFGEAMSVCMQADAETVRRALKGLTPAQLGFDVRPVWRDGLKASQGSTDFRMLFAGMAFMLMAAALLLSGLSLSLALETRQDEVALFRALGWSRGKVIGIWSAEWCVPLVVGALAGSGLGALLARTLVWSLGRFWRDAFAGAAIDFYFSMPVAALAASLSAVLTFAVLLRTVFRYAQCHPVELWQTAGRDPLPVPPVSVRVCPCLSVPWESLVGGILAAGALAVMLLSPSKAAAGGAFFGGGFLLMLSLALFVKTAGATWRDRKTRSESRAPGVGMMSPLAAGICRAVQAPRRSAPVVLLLAMGIFLTVGILSMKHDPAAGCERSSSGSGGFASIITSVTATDRAGGVERAQRVSGGTGVVPVRVHEGDEAGCLNMSQPQTPRLLGLDARTMARARAFEPEDAGGIWTLIERPLPDGTIPALAADQTMLHYSLKAKAGVTDGAVLNYAGTDGTVWRVRIVGALPVRSGILQGALILDERQFVRLFPEEGYRLWLSDYAPYLLREVAETSGREAGRSSLGHYCDSALVGNQGTEDRGRMAGDGKAVAALRHPEPGVTVETVEERLRLLGSVESAYLDMFLVLGGLGVVLGALGVALVILRGVEERRGELALLAAVGLPRRTVMLLLASEYGVLVLAGLVVGSVPALVAIQPAARALRGAMPWVAMAGIVGSLFLCAVLCVFVAAHAAASRFGLDVLKEEG